MNNKKNIKILVISHMYPNKSSPNQGIFIHNQIKKLLEEGYQIKVISPIPFAPKFLWFNVKWKNYGMLPFHDRVDGVDVHYPRYLNIPGKISHIFSTYSMCFPIKTDIDSVIRSFNPNIIHAHTATPDGYFGLRLKNKYNLPLICSLRGSDINSYPYVNKLTYRLTKEVITKADQILSVSDALRISAEEIAKPDRQIEVVYNGCEIANPVSDNITSDKLRTQLGISKSEVAILFVGRIEKDKGIYELLDAFSTLKSKGHNLHLILLGNCVESDVKSKISSLTALKNKIHVIGEQPHREVFNWLKSADLFVLPSYHEGLPNAILEAMSCGLPVVSTKIGGIPEIVEDGNTGILVNPKDSDALANAIDYLIKNDELARKMGKTGRDKVEQKFSWQQNAREIVQIYNKVLSQ